MEKRFRIVRKDCDIPMGPVGEMFCGAEHTQVKGFKAAIEVCIHYLTTYNLYIYTCTYIYTSYIYILHKFI